MKPTNHSEKAQYPIKTLFWLLFVVLAACCVAHDALYLKQLKRCHSIERQQSRPFIELNTGVVTCSRGATRARRKDVRISAAALRPLAQCNSWAAGRICTVSQCHSELGADLLLTSSRRALPRGRPIHEMVDHLPSLNLASGCFWQVVGDEDAGRHLEGGNALAGL